MHKGQGRANGPCQAKRSQSNSPRPRHEARALHSSLDRLIIKYCVVPDMQKFATQIWDSDLPTTLFAGFAVRIQNPFCAFTAKCDNRYGPSALHASGPQKKFRISACTCYIGTAASLLVLCILIISRLWIIPSFAEFRSQQVARSHPIPFIAGLKRARENAGCYGHDSYLHQYPSSPATVGRPKVPRRKTPLQ